MRIALVHDWLTGMRGGEKVLSLLCRLMPQADLLTLLRVPGACDRHIEAMRIVPSALNRLPGAGRYYRYLLPLMPWAIERMDATAYDLIVSCSHCVAKGVRRSPRSVHACYCFTPMRYVWGRPAEPYRRRMPLAGLALRAMTGRLRNWDLRSAANVDAFMANSRTVAGRIKQYYGREATVVYSPIDTEFFTPADEVRDDFYLMVAALSPYKRVDQAIAAFRQLGRPLRIIGAGPELARLRRTAPPNVELLGWQSDETVREHYRRCRAVIMPQEEDFGLVPLEAMACGSPAIAYAAGGALETVLDVERESDSAEQQAGSGDARNAASILAVSNRATDELTPNAASPFTVSNRASDEKSPGGGSPLAVSPQATSAMSPDAAVPLAVSRNLGDPPQPSVGPTGVLYTPQTPEALADAVRRFERVEGRFDRERLVAWARRFNVERFYAEFKQAVAPALAAKGFAPPW